MMSNLRYQSPTAVVRFVLAAATVVFGVLGLGLSEAKLLAAAGAFGILWTVWDLLWDRVLGPAVDWAARLLTEGVGDGPPADTRPTLDDTIRLLESHLSRDTARSVQIQAAVRLEEIYRGIRRDPARARDVIARVRERFPDAEELERYDERRDERDGGIAG